MPNQVGGAVLDVVLDLLGMDDIGDFDGYGDAGVATLVLDLENGFTVRHSWVTDVIKARAGAEQRISRNDIDRESYQGTAYLGGETSRAKQAELARYAAAGSVFLLGVPHEALSLRADAAGTTVYVDAISKSRRDWTVRGQRVAVVRRDADTGALAFVDAVIQSETADSITLNVDPGTLGSVGGVLVPTKPVFLEPQQDFDRYQTTVERWKLRAIGAPPLDYAPTLASYALAGDFAGLTIVSRDFGLVGNTYQVEAQAFGGAGAAGILQEGGGFVQWFFEPGVSTPADFVTAIDASAFVKLTGAPNTPAVALTGGDNFLVTLAGGADMGAVGTGAALTTYNGDGVVRPVWDEPVINGDTITDGVHAMTQVIEHGGIPYALGTADRPDWYRAISIATDSELTWQWFKLFMHTIRGCQEKFWLPTWRADLTFISKAANTITVSTADGSDFDAWFPGLREYIQIKETNGTITRAKITAAVDNGDGTRTLTIGTTIATSSVSMVSWLELCRFEDADEFSTVHTADGFTVSLKARVIQ